MILHASLKTDIAQFYSSWILNRLKAGYIDIENGKFIDRYYFKKNNLEKIYFWSKDPQPLIKRISELISCEYDFEIITEMSFYDKCYEPKIKSKQRILNDIRKVSKIIGKDKISFCYGPVFTTFNCSDEWHFAQFKFLCEQLKDYINKIYITFEISENCLHAKNYNITKISRIKQIDFINEFKKIAQDNGLEFHLKPESTNLKKDEIDIGQMNACPACCMYCIGLTNKRTVKIKNEKHNSSSSLLIGNIDYDAKIKEIDLSETKTKENNEFIFDFTADL